MGIIKLKVTEIRGHFWFAAFALIQKDRKFSQGIKFSVISEFF